MDLQIRNLSKTYAEGVHALRDVSLTITPGMFGLLGPNGAGKSTLMRIIATLQDPDEGSVRFGDLDVLRDKNAVRQVLGYLPQEFGFYPNVSAEKLLEHFAVLKGIIDKRARKDVVDALLERTNLAHARKRKLGGYSGGMRQRMGIALALLGNVKLIVVDEPTAGLDPAERLNLLNLLSEIGKDAVVILSTHIVDDVWELCSRMAIIDKGQILLEADPQVAAAALNGRIWQRIIDRSELPALQGTHAVISTKLVAGRTIVRVFAETLPDSGWAEATPNLEDVYFSTMTGHYGRKAEKGSRFAVLR